VNSELVVESNYACSLGLAQYQRSFTLLKNNESIKAHFGFLLNEFLHKRPGQNKIAYF
jgi:hypothetical protein